MLYLLVPAFVSGCQERELPGDADEVPRWHGTTPGISRSAIGEIEYLDAFVYDDGNAGRLDSYQRFEREDVNEGLYRISSLSGNKTVFLLCNGPKGTPLWENTCSLEALGNHSIHLEDDNPDRPVMFSLQHILSGKEYDVRLERIMSEIFIRTISCDFSDEAYSDCMMTDVKAFLMNVNAEWKISDPDGEKPGRILTYTDAFPIAESVGSSALYPGISMYCYPNTSPEESIGSPFTTLVIEGKINGHTYWYPIRINRNGEGKGVGHNSRYIFDIRILKTGITSPEGRMNEKVSDITMEVRRWEEKEWYDVTY